MVRKSKEENSEAQCLRDRLALLLEQVALFTSRTDELSSAGEGSFGFLQYQDPQARVNRLTSALRNGREPNRVAVYLVKSVVEVLAEGPDSEGNIKKAVLERAKAVNIRSNQRGILTGNGFDVPLVCAVLNALGIVEEVTATNEMSSAQTAIDSANEPTVPTSSGESIVDSGATNSAHSSSSSSSSSSCPTDRPNKLGDSGKLDVEQTVDTQLSVDLSKHNILAAALSSAIAKRWGGLIDKLLTEASLASKAEESKLAEGLNDTDYGNITTDNGNRSIDEGLSSQYNNLFQHASDAPESIELDTTSANTIGDTIHPTVLSLAQSRDTVGYSSEQQQDSAIVQDSSMEVTPKEEDSQNTHLKPPAVINDSLEDNIAGTPNGSMKGTGDDTNSSGVENDSISKPISSNFISERSKFSRKVPGKIWKLREFTRIDYSMKTYDYLPEEIALEYSLSGILGEENLLTGSYDSLLDQFRGVKKPEEGKLYNTAESIAPTSLTDPRAVISDWSLSVYQESFASEIEEKLLRRLAAQCDIPLYSTANRTGTQFLAEDWRGVGVSGVDVYTPESDLDKLLDNQIAVSSDSIGKDGKRIVPVAPPATAYYRDYELFGGEHMSVLSSGKDLADTRIFNSAPLFDRLKRVTSDYLLEKVKRSKRQLCSTTVTNSSKHPPQFNKKALQSLTKIANTAKKEFWAIDGRHRHIPKYLFNCETRYSSPMVESDKDTELKKIGTKPSEAGGKTDSTRIDTFFSEDLSSTLFLPASVSSRYAAFMQLENESAPMPKSKAVADYYDCNIIIPDLRIHTKPISWHSIAEEFHEVDESELPPALAQSDGVATIVPQKKWTRKKSLDGADLHEDSNYKVDKSNDNWISDAHRNSNDRLNISEVLAPVYYEIDVEKEMNGSDEASTIIIDEDLSDSACLERNEKVLQDMRDKWAVMSQLKLETSRESSASTMKIFGGVGGGAYRMAIQQQSNPEDINRSRTKQKSPNPGTNKSKSHSVATENMKSIKSSVGNADDTDSSDIRASLGEGLRAILDDPNNAALGMYAGYYRGIPVLFNSDGTVVDISLKKLASSSTRVVASASSSAPTTTGNRRGGYKNINQSKTKGRASDDQSRTNQPHSREKSDDGGHNVDALDFGSIIGIKRRGRPPKSQKVRTLTHPNGGVSGYEIDDNAGSNSGSYTDNNSACNSDNIGDHNSTDDQETFVNQSRSRRNESNSFGAK